MKASFQYIRLRFFALCTALLSIAAPVQGTVVGWGTNSFGSLSIPAGLVGAKTVAAGDYHGLAITISNRVVAWGANDLGQINVPASLTNVIGVAAGRAHSLALKASGTLVGWGVTSNNYNPNPNFNYYFGQSDIPTDATNITKISAGEYHYLTLRNDGTVCAWGYNFYGQTNVPTGLSNIVDVAAGGYFSLALKNDGTVVAWGDDYYGQTEVPMNLSNVVAVAAGGIHALALKSDGSVVGWGAHGLFDYTYDFGQADPPSNLTNAVSIEAGFFHSLAVLNNGTVRQWGDTSLGQSNPPIGLTNVLAVAGGFAHSYALIFDAPPQIIIQPTNVVSVTNKAVSFVVQAAGTLPLRATWYRSSTTNAILGAVTFSNATITASFSGGSVVGTMTNLANPQFTLNLLASYVTTTNAVNYYVVVTNLAGSVTSSVASLTVLLPPKITSQPVGVATNEGATVVFNAGVTGSQPINYQWYLNGNPLALLGQTNRLQLDSISTNDAGSYQIVVSNAVGSATSSVAVLTVGGAPAIAQQPGNLSVRLGSNATFSAAVSGSLPLVYQWYYFSTNGSVISSTSLLDGTNVNYTVFNAQPSDGGNYFFVVANNFGSVTSSAGLLTVVIPPTLLNQPTNVVSVTNKAVSFVVQVAGSQPLRAAWYRSANTNTLLAAVTFSNTTITASFSGGSVSGAMTNLANPQFTLNLLASYVVTSNAVNYFVVVSNLAGVVTSSVANLTVLIPPKVTNQPVSVATNEGATVVFNAGVTGSQPINYQWYLNGNPLALLGQTNRLQLDSISTNDAGSYQIVVSNAVGSATSSVAALTLLINGSYNAPYIWLLNHSRAGGDAIMIALEAGRNYRVQSSTDLAAWNDVTNFLSHGSVVTFTNYGLSNSDSLYYRVVTP